MGVYSHARQNARENENKEEQGVRSSSGISKNRVPSEKKDCLASSVSPVGETSGKKPSTIVKIESEEDSSTMAPTTSDSDSIDAVDSEIENRNKSCESLIHPPLLKKPRKEIDEDSIKMPPPPLPARFRKKINIKVDVDAEPSPPPPPPAPPLGRDWHEHLKTMYGSVETALEHPWLEEEEREALSRNLEKKKLEKFTSQVPDWVAGMTDEDPPLFALPKTDGLDAEICKELQFIRDSINLYRTLRLPNSSKEKLQRPFFLPFLKRNLRYHNYIPVSAEPVKSKFPGISKSESQSKFSKVENSDTSIDNESSDFSDQDMSIKLISVKHNLLPAGHSASITFFYTKYSYDSRSFLPVSKIDSSTFIMDVKDDTTPVNIDLPADLEFNENDPSDVFIILRVVFFDSANDTQLGAGDSALFGAFQLTKTNSEGWSFSCGTISLVLVETEKLEIDPNTSHWQKDGSIVFRMIALGRKYHMNPFVYMEVTCEDDDSVISVELKKSKRQKRKSNEISESSNVSDDEQVEKEENFDFSLPPVMIYQLSLEFMHKPGSDSVEKVITGFNAVVEDESTLPESVQRIQNSRRTETKESRQLQTTHHEALGVMDKKAPTPKMFTFEVTRAPGWCIFCEIHCKNLFELMWHLRTCHERFTYVYRSAIEYRAGRFLPGFVMAKAGVEEDLFWYRRKRGMFGRFKRDWPQKFTLDEQFVTPCNFLFKNVVDKFQDIAPTLSLKEEFNFMGPRPLNYTHNVHGRLVNLLPDWITEKIERDLTDIVDLDSTEIVFMLLWNKFLFEFGPIAGKEMNVYRLCRLFIESHRKEISEYHLEVVTCILVTYFVEENILSSDELYDLMMRFNKNYDPFTDILHPLSVSERIRAQQQMKKDAARAEKLKRKRPKKTYEKSTISLRRRGLEDGSTETSRSTSHEPSGTPDVQMDESKENVIADAEMSESMTETSREDTACPGISDPAVEL
ncbi:hypothetical protein FO519_002555 [Halicephalobus sp. NKZ332]|nr:hypothetical protein FO519_002555 [Halicephalobus sp. NKZ332]